MGNTQVVRREFRLSSWTEQHHRTRRDWHNVVGAFGLWTAEMSTFDRSGLFRYNTLVLSDGDRDKNSRISDAYANLGVLGSSLSTRGCGWIYFLEAAELDHGQSYTTQFRIVNNSALRNLLQIICHRRHTNGSRKPCKNRRHMSS